jgi:hypothetical protein
MTALEPVSKFPIEPSASISLVASWDVITTCAIASAKRGGMRF